MNTESEMRIILMLGVVCSFSCTAPQKPLVMSVTAASAEEDRRKFYEQHKATKLNQSTYTQEDGSVMETGRYHSIVLGNKQTITDPRALSAVVAEGSVTEQQIDTFEKKKKRERLLVSLNWTGIATSITLMSIGASMTVSESVLTSGGKALVTSGAILFGGLMVPGVMRLSATQEKRAARTEAFLSYNESLLSKLDLCEEGEQLFDCDNAANFAANQISVESDPTKPLTFDACDEQRALGFSLSEECQSLLKRGAPQQAPDPEEALREPDLAEQEFALLLSLAEVLMRANKHDEALARLEDAKKLRPEESLLLFAFGEVYRSKGELNTACEQYRAYLKSPSVDENTAAEINTFVAGVDKTKHKSCNFK
jgi:hypothetical protein